MCYVLMVHVPRRNPIAAFLRIVSIALMVLMCSGIPSLVNAAVHEHTDECSDCGSDCPGNCDSKSCPPGPLCPCAPHVIAAERVVIVLAHLVACAQPETAAPDTRLPASIDGDGVFHPPRHLA